MLKFTSTISRLTWAIAVMTAVNVILVGLEILG
jgi:hypothetical protein